MVWAGKVETPLPSMSTARIRLWLVQVDESDPKHLKWGVRPSGMINTVVLEEAAGSLPKLPIGSFWRDRTQQIKHLMPQDINVTNTAIGPQTWQIVRANDQVFGRGGTHISANEYPLSGEDARGTTLFFNDAPLVRCFTDSGLELLIPCYEIFRRFYGLTSELANAMLAGHWKRELATLVDMDHTKPSEDGRSFEVLPQVALRDMGCLGIAYFMTNAWAGNRVAEIFTAIENARRSGSREPWIFALPPWQDQTMTLSFAGHQLVSGAVLVQWIYGSQFPDMSHEVVRIIPEDRLQFDSADAAVQTRSTQESRLEERDCATIRPAADARSSRSAMHFSLSESWEGLTRVKRIPRTRTYVPVNPKSDGAPPKRLQRLTTGRRSEVGRSGTASLSSDSHNVILDRFKALAECFSELAKAGSILAREDYALVNPVQIGDRAYCAFPTSIGGVPRSWALVNWEDPRARLCWVSEITSTDGSLYYWFEVEASSRKGGKALVVKPNSPGSRLNADTLEAILKAGVSDKGQWKKSALLTVEEQARWVSARHTFAAGKLRSSVVLGKIKSLQQIS